ncbi:MAG: GTPase family protein [Polyangiaceae bacterium]
MVDRLRHALRIGAPRELLSATDRARLEHALDEELGRVPRIAMIGETGVGKSSTINALFAEGLPVSHSRACTQLETELDIAEGRRLRVIDLPGLGEDLEADKRHEETYARVLPGVDVVLWILKADNRAMTHVQAALRRLIRRKILNPRRLVVALNQVDLLQPGAWDLSVNQPSVEQEQTIAERRNDVQTKLRQATRRLPDRQIVAYSALRFFNLELLLEALLLACDDERRWILKENARCADFNSLVPETTVTTETPP